MGDVVKYVGEYDAFEGIQIIDKIEDSEYNEYEFEYSTTKGAWIPHNELKLVRECDAKSIKQLRGRREEY